MKEYRILLVGGAGALGSDILASNLYKLPNFTFFVLDDFSESRLTEMQVSKYCHYKNANTADLSSVREVFNSFKPNVIIYLATTLSNDQNKSLQSNVIGLSNVITESSLGSAPHIIYIQSFLTRDTHQPITENTPITARDSYSTWKLAGELLLDSYFGKKTTVILSSVTSPLISVGAIPIFIKKILNNQSIKITETYRDYIDPQSFINALKIIVENNFESSVFVIGTGVELGTQDVLKQVSLCLGVDTNQLKVEVVNSKPSDPRKITLDSSLFQELTQWHPEFKLSEQIQQIIKNFDNKETEIRLHH